jgi:glutathione synthase/RimK-type ligase-like ATP-grasp enzyme
VGEFPFAIHQFLDDAETVEAGHLNVEEDEIRRMFLDESESFDAILALADKMDLGETFQQVSEFVARGFFVINDESIYRHDWAWTWA